ncbi:hypothetical protein [Flavobacterium sp. C3NV]|uniref:hypothetical protein n=1 Tax=Flavobacterium sp. C3NV TaxID=3393358 RepID=UPI0039901A08
MVQKILSLIMLLLSLNAKSQNVDESIETEDHSISAQLYTKCFENLNQGAEILEKYPAFKETKPCSLAYCMMLLSYKDEEIKLVAEQRLQGIATQLFQEGNPVYLISGMDSFLTAQEKNKNLEDDHHIVYISYAECTSPEFLRRSADIVNAQTMQLIKQNSLR